MGWIAELSNGETAKESSPIAGEMTSWQKLLSRCREENITITELRLVVNGITVEALPSSKCFGYFQAYESSKIMFRDTVNNKQGIGSIIGDLVYISWINIDASINNMNYVYQDVRPLKEVLIHTTVN